MSRTAKIALVSSLLASAVIIWGVHFMQHFERETMYKGVLRDDERRRDKMRQREAEFQESQRKRELYERVQNVSSTASKPPDPESKG